MTDTAAAERVPVIVTRDDDVLVVTIDHPPVNALSHAVRRGLVEAVDQLARDETLRAMVIASTGKVFIGGADIREFGGPRLEPYLNSVCARIDASHKPIVASVHGAALGGGFEVALASHGRVASPVATVAFPEVKLGLLPGAGGTQRSPRVCGATLALDLMLTGRAISAAEAKDAGLIDVIDDEPFTAAVSLARSLAQRVTSGGVLPRARDGRALVDRAPVDAAIARARVQVTTQYADLYSPARIVDCVVAAASMPFDEGCAYEAQAFLDCLESPQRKVLVERFFAERAAKKR